MQALTTELQKVGMMAIQRGASNAGPGGGVDITAPGSPKVNKDLTMSKVPQPKLAYTPVSPTNSTAITGK